MGGRGASSSGAKAGGATKAAAKAGGAIASAATGAASKVLAGVGDASAAVVSQLGAQARAGQKTLDQLIAEAGGAVSPTLKAATRGPVPSGPAFARLANTAAAAVPKDERWGDRKVFISDAFAVAKKKQSDLTLDSFKSGLLEERRAGRVRLARADLRGALDPAKVEASETIFGDTAGAYVTFIEVDP